MITSQQPDSALLAVKMLLALYAKGHDATEFIPYVVQQTASPDAKIRHLAQIFIAEHVQSDPQNAILAVNTLQRSLTDPDPIIRACALKTLSSISIRDALPAIQDAVVRMVGDPSPYVKKEAGFAMIKAAEVDPNEIDFYLPYIERLLGETSPIAFSGAIAAYWSLCPDNIELLHPRYRFMCQNIRSFDAFCQVFVLRSLTVYCRYCFRAPPAEAVDESPEAFWGDENENKNERKATISADHLSAIHAAKRLLSSPCAAVVLAATAFLFYCGPAAHISAVGRSLVRLIYEGPTTAELSLTAIVPIAKQYPHVFLPHVRHFYVHGSDSASVKRLKIRLLSALATSANADALLNELASYAGSNDRPFAAAVVKTMGLTALSNEAIIPTCLTTLLRLMGRAQGTVLSEVVVVLSLLLRRRRGTEDEAQTLKHLCRKFVLINDGNARAAVLSIVGDMHETHPDVGPTLLRYVAQNFASQNGEVRLQAMTLAAKLLAVGTTSEIPLYLLKICERDAEFDVRDRAKFLLALIENKSEKIRSRLRSLLFPPRQEPNWSGVERPNQYTIGTFSQLFDRALGGYDPLPDWAPEEELPDPALRAVVKTLRDGTKVLEGGDDDEDDGKVLDFNDFFKDDDDEGAAEEDELEYSDERAEYDDAPDAPNGPEGEEDEDEDIEDFFN
jgi:AP-3 complex subunit beta